MKKFVQQTTKSFLFYKYSTSLPSLLVNRSSTHNKVIPKSLVPAPKNKLLEDILDTVFVGGNNFI